MSLVRRCSMLALLGVVFCTSAAWAQAPKEKAVATEQTWEGVLKPTPAVELKLVFKVREADGGALSATMDSPDQGAFDMPVDDVTRDAKIFTFSMNRIKARFEGKVSNSGDEAVGIFQQGAAKFPLTLKKTGSRTVSNKPAGNEQIFEGRIAAGPGLQLRVVVHVLKDESGGLTAKFDSPDQGAMGLPVKSVKLDKTTFSLDMPSIAGKYEGKPNADGDVIEGTWTQAGNSMPLKFKKVDKAAEIKRPQTPKPPLSYKTEDVTYPNKAGGITLAGTLTTPKAKGPFPAVLLISGSGAQDRDETIFAHKPFAVIADALTKRGIAVLRVDDRGVGGSTGSTANSTTDDFAGDVLAGVAYLKSRKDIDPKSIGLIGHSEGGIIAPLASTRSKDVAFIVLMAGTGLPGEEIVYLQGKLIASAMGAPKELLDFNREVQEKMFAIVKAEKDPKAASVKLREVVKRSVEKLPEEDRKQAATAVEGQIGMLETPWFRYFLTYDPRPTLAKVKVPVLALVGEKDLQVPPKENLSEIEKTLKEGGNRRVTIKELPGLNHLFQTCKTGSTAEYAQIEETIAPSALSLMGDWIHDHVRKQ